MDRGNLVYRLFGKKEFEAFIKDLLSLDRGGKWTSVTVHDKLEIRVGAIDKESLLTEIRNWIDKRYR